MCMLYLGAQVIFRILGRLTNVLLANEELPSHQSEVR